MSEPGLRLSDEGRGRRELAHLLLLLLLLGAYALPFSLQQVGRLSAVDSLLSEDGVYEWVGALACIAGGLLMLGAYRTRRSVLALLVGLLMLAVAGEELSWGQRLLGFEAPEWFTEHNHQGDLTLHNLDVFGEVNNATSDFGTDLLQLYLLALPLLLAAFPTLASLARRARLPVPGLAVAFLAGVLKYLNREASERFAVVAGTKDRFSIGEIFETSLELLLLAVAVDFWFTARRDSKPSDQPQEQVPAGGGGG